MKVSDHANLKVGKPYLVYYSEMSKKIAIGRFLGMREAKEGTKKFVLGFRVLITHRSGVSFHDSVFKVRSENQDKKLFLSNTGTFFELTEDEFLLQCALQI